ncbi:helix-turn-helix transcriptional regulator [Actinoplanes sp. TFC3]|uniref:helix-turn-helix domain-containing protein n=1 Tax=Actinoplanes sp. TFC3 TaxID=1710355 RepID=UPI0009EA726A|nr:helix-turn-helix transcriptional regulator [Actinoplanes sp. TFC3]
MNERLRTSMMRQGVTTEDLAVECGIDVKSVERWISLNRVPHRQHRWAAAKLLGADEVYLWPGTLRQGTRRQDASKSELVELYPDRASVPRETWLRLLNEAQNRIDVLVHSGTFFAQVQPRIARMLNKRADEGVQIRLCFGDPRGAAVSVRDLEEGLGGTLQAKIRASLTYYTGLTEVENVEIRLHDTTLYNSLFRYDDHVIVNGHVYGEPASLNPTLHLRRIDGGVLFDHYISSFERVWLLGRPWLGNE